MCQGRNTFTPITPTNKLQTRLVLEGTDRQSLLRVGEGRDLRNSIGNGKVRPTNRLQKPREEWTYSSTLSLTSALDGVDI